MARPNVEVRLTAIETELASLKKQVAANDQPKNNWLTESFGVYADFPEYDQVIEYGRKYRESLKPSTKVKAARQPKKSDTQKA